MVMCLLGAVVSFCAATARANDAQDVLVIVGAPGAPQFAEGFRAAAEAWRHACERAGAACTIVGLDAETLDARPDHEQARAWFEKISPDGARAAWIVYLGHGTYDGKDARLNLRGPDLTAAELKEWLARLRRPVVFVDGGSASGPLLPLLSAPGRIVITATQSGDEVNYARFGERFADVVGSPAADLDQDGQTSVLEAFLIAEQQTQLFYTEENRMASEHALIDDNGDKRGTPADWFQGTRAVKRAQDGAAPDGDIAHKLALVETPAERALTGEQRAARDTLEQQLEALRARKKSMEPDDYLRELEVVLRKLSAIYLPPAEETPAPQPQAPAADS
jgi:hypothetical protein